MPWPKGKPHTIEQKEHQSKVRKNQVANGIGVPPSRRGIQGPGFKGQAVGYGALHEWVRRHLGQPDTCEHCGQSGLVGHKIHWANKSGRYLRDLTDWIRLCVPCHGKFDAKKRRQICV